MMLGVLQSNRENILTALHHYQHQLSILELALMSNDEAMLESTLSSAQARYQGMIHLSLLWKSFLFIIPSTPLSVCLAPSH